MTIDYINKEVIVTHPSKIVQKLSAADFEKMKLSVLNSISNLQEELKDYNKQITLIRAS